MSGIAGVSSDAASSSAYHSMPDVKAFSVLARRALTNALDRIAGAKTLVLDPLLAGPLGLVAEMSLLRDHGVDRIFWLEPGALSQAQKHIVYICKAEISCMRIIADQIKSALPALNHTYTILLTPRATSVCASALEDLGVLGSVDIAEFPMSLLPLERDLLSMELGASAYKDIFLDSNYDSIYELGRALVTLQRAFGLIPRILGKGDAARRLADIMIRLRKESAPMQDSSSAYINGAGHSPYGPIDSIILIDRQVDMVTPLCTQLTYEGLVDEIVGIKNAAVELDASITNPAPPTPSSSTAAHFGAQQPPKKKKHLLSTLNSANAAGAATSMGMSASGSGQGSQQEPQPPGADPLFGDLRDRNFAVVGNILNRTAKRINADYEGRHQAQTVGQMREFVGRLSGLQAEHQALRLHTSLTEQIMQVTGQDVFNRVLEIQQNLVAGLDIPAQETSIRDLIYQEANVFTVIRLLCMLSLVGNGIKPKILEEIKRDLLQTYGFEYLPLLISLADLGLLTKVPPNASSSARSPFASVRKPLRLIVDEIDESDPEDIAYVYSGYAPASIRLVQHAVGIPVQSSTGGFMAGLPGVGGTSRDRQTTSGVVGWKGLDEVLRTLPGAVFEEYQSPDQSETRQASNSPDQVPLTVVCFIGGCTYTEVTALRFTSQRLSGRNILVVTTGMVNGSSLIAGLGPPRTGALR